MALYATLEELASFRRTSIILNKISEYSGNEMLTLFLLIAEWQQYYSDKYLSREQITALLNDATDYKFNIGFEHIRFLIQKLKNQGFLAKNERKILISEEIYQKTDIQIEEKSFNQKKKDSSFASINIQAVINKLKGEIALKPSWNVAKNTVLPEVGTRDAALLFFIRNSIVLEKARNEKYKENRLLFYILLKAEFQMLFMKKLGSHYKDLSNTEIVDFIMQVCPLSEDTKKIDVSTIQRSTSFLSIYFDQSKKILDMDAIENAKAVKWKKIPLVQRSGLRDNKQSYNLAAKMDELKGQVNAKWPTLDTKTETRVSKPEEKQEIEEVPRDIENIVISKTVELIQPVDQTFPPENLVISETIRDPNELVIAETIQQPMEQEKEIPQELVNLVKKLINTQPVKDPTPKEDLFDSDVSTDEDEDTEDEDKKSEDEHKKTDRKRKYSLRYFPIEKEAKRDDEDTCNKASQPPQLKTIIRLAAS